MNNPLQKLNNNPSSALSMQAIVLTAIVWGLMALLFYLLFSVPIENPDGTFNRVQWYIFGTYIFQLGANLGAAILCFRNWLSPTIVSGPNVWLGIGFGMLSYFLGNLILAYWELILQQEPIISPGDLFFIGTYLFLGWGMITAVYSRRLNLQLWQWGVVAGIGVIGIALAIWIFSGGDSEPSVDASSGWVSLLVESLLLFYIVADVLLLIIATMLLLAFWGGRFSQSWRMIAAAVFCLYIADMWLQYADKHIENYQSGALVEVFWVFSGVLFAIGAALEYWISSRTRREKRSRRRV